MGFSGSLVAAFYFWNFFLEGKRLHLGNVQSLHATTNQ